MQTLVTEPRSGAAGDIIAASPPAPGADKNTVFSVIQHTSSPAVSPVARCGPEALSVSMNANTAHRTIDELPAKIDAADAVPGTKMQKILRDSGSVRFFPVFLSGENSVDRLTIRCLFMFGVGNNK